VIADTLAAVAAGAREPEVAALRKKLHVEGRSSVVGSGLRAAPSTAAFLNGVAGTWLEMDEGNRFSRGHPSVHVLPAALAYAEMHRLSGRELLLAVVLGYEVGARIGIAANLRPSMHPHGTWGTVGAALAVAKLAGADAAKMREVINVSSSLTLATSKNTMLQGGTVRNAYAGVSNQMGLLAWDMVEAGFSGERDGLASVFGHVVSESFDPAKMIEGLGKHWEIDRNYFKRHSCCRYNHGTLDALDRLLSTNRVKPEDVERVDVESYRYAAELDDQAPRNVLAAKFSVPFAVATRLVTGSSGMASFTWERVRDPAIQALSKKVFVREDPALTAKLPQLRPARLKMKLRDGRMLEGSADANRGDDQDPYSRDELREKFFELSERAWPRSAVEAVHQKLQQLETLEDVSQLFS